MPLKAELHCHIEGAAAPELVLRQARKYARDASPYIRDGAFVWDDFTSFLAAYDFSADLFRTEEDYAQLAEHYLTSLARDGAIYSEIFTSPDHAGKAGLSPKAYTDALGEGILRARAKTGIEGRMIVTGVRHAGVEEIERAARFAARCGHPLVTGFGVAGDERVGDVEDYVRAFEIAREARVTTILNPAPAASLPDRIYKLCDYVTPNETEAEELTGIKVASIDDARRAAESLLEKGVGAVIVTLGEKGALLHTKDRSDHVGAVNAGPVVETTGAGDAFNGGLAAALAKGVQPLEAVRFACAVAGISVTRPGTAPSMPTLDEVEALLAGA